MENDEILKSWNKFISIIREKITIYETKIREEFIKTRNYETLLNISKKGKDNFDILLNNKEILVSTNKLFDQFFDVYLLCKENGSLSNPAMVNYLNDRIDTIIEDYRKLYNEGNKRVDDLNVKLEGLYHIVEKRSYEGIKDILGEIEMSEEDIVNVLSYVCFLAGTKVNKSEAKSAKFKPAQKPNAKEIEDEIERIKGIKERIQSEIDNYNGVNKRYQELFQTCYELTQQTFDSKMNPIIEQLGYIEGARVNVEEVIDLINAGDADVETNLEFLASYVSDFQSNCDKLNAAYNNYMAQKGTALESDEEIKTNPNVYFYIYDPSNIEFADRAQVFPELATQEISDGFFSRNRTKKDNDNLSVAGRIIYFKQYAKNSVISFVRAGGTAENAKILVFASTSIKNKGTDEIHRLTEKVTKNEEDIEKLLKDIEMQDPECMEMQNYFRTCLAEKISGMVGGRGR